MMTKYRDEELVGRAAEWIAEYQAREGIPPTIAELAEAMGIALATAQRMKKHMESLGIIASRGRRWGLTG